MSFAVSGGLQFRDRKQIGLFEERESEEVKAGVQMIVSDS
jgi:hypothetical protein